jgi:Emfourin
VIIKVERSGGFTGIPLSNEVDAKDLPPALVTTAKKIMINTKSSSSPPKSTPRGAADHYTYKISIQDGVNRRVIECNQHTIQDDLKLLIKYVEKNSKRVK